MNDVNKAAAVYLRHYCEDARSFDYAVMLSGPWGAGKTHFVKKFLAQHKVKHLYVSLYGMTTTRQIEEEFWRQLHPLLSSKPMRILSAFGKGFLKATIKIDLDQDGKDDGSLSPSAPDVDLVKMANPAGHVLVFDDLERCRMPLDEVLGYINSLVEHSGFKVIVVANEVELAKLENEKFPDIKEKLFGQTLDVRSSVEDALSEFLEGIADEIVHDYLTKNQSVVVEVYRTCACDNLRVLKNALWDFERFAADFPANVWKRKDIANWLLRVTLALAMEFRLGQVSRDEIVDLFANKMVRLVRCSIPNPNGEEAESSRVEILEDKYDAISFDQANFDGRIIADGLQKGWFEPEVTRRGFTESAFFAKRSDQAAWKTVWSMIDVDDREFNLALKKMVEQFRGRSFLKPGEILHVAGLKLFLASEGITMESRSEVVADVKAYIDDLRASEQLEEGRIADYLGHFGGWSGLGIFERDKPEYREMFLYLQDSMLRAQDESLPRKAEKLVSELSKQPSKFAAKVVSYGGDAEYYRLPLLKHIEVGKFVDAVIGLPAVEQRRVMSSLKARYDHRMLAEELASELPWLVQLREEMLRRAHAMQGISKWRLIKLVEWNLEQHLSGATRADQE